ncbi:MAG: FixH family protein [Beijerinckiaceae bacterium]|jgi:nitrogen fixation protein FixH|nr:FixH family protein [Beijerinckiaceae bacterium]MDO9439571.1 FixH family protein [Beijerinckiaceae bacterium]
MIPTPTQTQTVARPSGFVLTGRMVLACFLAFFGTVFSVNFYMAKVAIATFSGLEAEKPYQSGLKWDAEIARARAQDQRGWTVDATVRPGANGASVVELRQQDAAALATPGLVFDARFSHPADRRRDLRVEMTKIEPGLYRAEAMVSEGRWELVLEARKGDELVFRSQNRLDIPGAR